jgi:hypothetical protein
MMNIPVDKNRTWMASLHKSINQLDDNLKSAIMKPAGQACATDLLTLCEKYLGNKIHTVDELISGWNIIRDRRKLTGRWESHGDTIRGVFGECGCPLVRSGLIELHPVQCYCSQGMMETIFSRFSKKPVEVKILRSIGRGDEACDFLIKL